MAVREPTSNRTARNARNRVCFLRAIDNLQVDAFKFFATGWRIISIKPIKTASAQFDHATIVESISHNFFCLQLEKSYTERNDSVKIANFSLK